MEQIPSESLENILLNLPYADVISYCQISQDAYRLCLDNTFWKNKYYRDFGAPRAYTTVGDWHLLYESRVGFIYFILYKTSHFEQSGGAFRTLDSAIRHIIEPRQIGPMMLFPSSYSDEQVTEIGYSLVGSGHGGPTLGFNTRRRIDESRQTIDRDAVFNKLKADLLEEMRREFAISGKQLSIFNQYHYVAKIYSVFDEEIGEDDITIFKTPLM